MKYVFKGLLLIVFMSVSVSGFAQNAQQRLLDHLETYQQLSGQFTQIISSEQNTKSQSSTGEFWISKPSQFRWHYTTPYIQKIISNGKKVWVYDEDLEQVSIKAASQAIGSSPLAIILGTESLEKSFDVQELADDEDLQWLQLIPKSEDSGFESMKLGFKQGTLSRMVLQDNFGQTTRLLFTDVVLNHVFEDLFFEFKVPQGVDVFDEMAN